jgi:single-stranded-DNA-specific exonuclease
VAQLSSELNPLEPLLGVEKSLAGKRWQLRPADDRLAQALAQQLELPAVLGRVLAARGVGLDEAAGYLEPTLKTALPDPSRFRDMDQAAERLAQAIREGERIAIFGDYDVDGATSTALLLRFMAAVGGQAEMYIPDRQREGYGPNAPALLELAAKGVGLVVTVDCGIAAHDALAAAAGAGLEVIVVDHHQAEPELPPARAIVNPNRLDEEPGYGQLAAVGVAFLLVIACNRCLRTAGWYQSRPEPDLMAWLDLVALGTICDVVPLVGLNRALVAQGLKIMATRRNPGLKALADVAGLASRPGTYHAGFVLGPRVNAGGRVGQADLGAQLLSTNDAMEAQGIARELDRLNTERRDIEAAVQEEALEQVEAALDGDKPGPILIAARGGWHPGVVGIVASRLKDHYRRPAFVIAMEDGIGKGSGRSLRGVDLGAAVIAARQEGLIMAGGGHAMAAGLTVAEDRLDEVSRFLSDRLAPQVAALGSVASLEIDAALGLSAATVEFLDLLDQAGPFGAGNPEPRFVLPSATLAFADVVGQDHVRCRLSTSDGGKLKAIAFRALERPLGRALLEARGARLHLAGHLRADEWRGRREVQLHIEDAAPAETI